MVSSWKNNRQFWLGMVISLACLAAIFFFIDPRDIWQALRSAQPGNVLLMALGMVLFLVLRAVRWQLMLGHGIPWRPVFHIQNVGYMFNMTLPFRLGDVARAVLIGNVPPATLASGVSTMVVERMLDMLFMVTLLPFTLLAVPALPAWMRSGARAFGVVSIVGIIILIVAASQRPFAARIAMAILDKLPFLETAVWLRRLDELLAGVDSLTRLKDGLLLIVMSIVLWLPILFAYYVGMRSVGITLPWLQVGFIVCAAAFSVALPSSPGQIGVFHAGVIAALQVLGQDEAASAGFAIVYHATNLTTMVLMGLFGLSGIGATFGNVVDSAQRFLTRRATTDRDT